MGFEDYTSASASAQHVEGPIDLNNTPRIAEAGFIVKTIKIGGHQRRKAPGRSRAHFGGGR